MPSFPSRLARALPPLALGLGLVIAACAGDSKSDKDARVGQGTADGSQISSCGPHNCQGCCVGDVCESAPTAAACGRDGVQCVQCPSVGGNPPSCLNGACEGVDGSVGPKSDGGARTDGPKGDTGPCKPSCAGKCKGADDKCNGTCPTNGCSGCCTAAFECYGGMAVDRCGKGGVLCEDCKAKSMNFCVANACVATCTPKCDGKCDGADDGCNGKCATNKCTGCCKRSTGVVSCQVGTSDLACGKNGETCEPCKNLGGICNKSTKQCE
ncbi:MAG: hypothetical protein IT371_05960 [Deltaproteobacteria bacterium]|nr:hypothetical protein [Deltaproteobacteria bacterium]